MTIGVYNILDLIESQGEDVVRSLVSDFSTKHEHDGEEVILNPDRERKRLETYTSYGIINGFANLRGIPNDSNLLRPDIYE